MTNFHLLVPILKFKLGFNSFQIEKARRALKEIAEKPHG